jgi:phytanoyl-CoA hydroxylase
MTSPDRHAFDREGFIVVRGFLSVRELVDLNRQLDRYIREVVPRQPATHAFYQDKQRAETLKQLQFLEEDAFFEGYRRHPRWVDLWESLMGVEAGGFVPKWFNKPPGADPGMAHPTPPHQDNFYAFYVPCDYATIWVALDAADAENGGLHYLPGSHRRGFRPHATTQVLGFSQGITDYGQADLAAEVAVPLQPGDALVHHGMTIHRADANRSKDRQRRAFAIEMTGVGIGQDEEAYARHRSQVAAQHQRLGVKSAR